MSGLPFHSFTFTLVEDKRPRVMFKMAAVSDEGGLYELEIRRGSASSSSVLAKRRVPLETAARLRDALQEAGAYGWEESYGDESAPGSRRWTMNVVFQEGVFSLAARGGSDIPAGFGRLLEELYRLDFPRPSEGGLSGPGAAGPSVGGALNALGLGSLGSIGGLSAGDVGAYAATGKAGAAGVDFSKLAEMMGSFGGADGEMARLVDDVQRDPQALERRMKDEFRHMDPSGQRALIDMLVQAGMGTREFWERFFRS